MKPLIEIHKNNLPQMWKPLRTFQETKTQRRTTCNKTKNKDYVMSKLEYNWTNWGYSLGHLHHPERILVMECIYFSSFYPHSSRVSTIINTYGRTFLFQMPAMFQRSGWAGWVPQQNVNTLPVLLALLLWLTSVPSINKGLLPTGGLLHREANPVCRVLCIDFTYLPWERTTIFGLL